MLDKAAADAAYGPWFSAAVKKNVVSEELNVRQVVAKVLLGEADAGVVYKTDLSVSEVSAVRTIEIPDPLNVIALYPIAVTANASQASLARAFVDHVRSPEGRTTLQKYNFLAP
jgi:molybdate transport system substrate-binding protein